MYIEVYLFYISLAGIIVLLTYKAMVVREFDKVNKNSIHFDPFPKARLWILRLFQTSVLMMQKYVTGPLGSMIFGIVVFFARTGARTVIALRELWRKILAVAQRSEIASRHVERIVILKKRIMRRVKKDLKNEKL